MRLIQAVLWLAVALMVKQTATVEVCETNTIREPILQRTATINIRCTDRIISTRVILSTRTLSTLTLPRLTITITPTITRTFTTTNRITLPRVTITATATVTNTKVTKATATITNTQVTTATDTVTDTQTNTETITDCPLTTAQSSLSSVTPDPALSSSGSKAHCSPSVYLPLGIIIGLLAIALIVVVTCWVFTKKWTKSHLTSPEKKKEERDKEDRERPYSMNIISTPSAPPLIVQPDHVTTSPLPRPPRGAPPPLPRPPQDTVEPQEYMCPVPSPAHSYKNIPAATQNEVKTSNTPELLPQTQPQEYSYAIAPAVKNVAYGMKAGKGRKGQPLPVVQKVESQEDDTYEYMN